MTTAEQFREIAVRAGGRGEVLKRTVFAAVEASACVGRLSHQESFTMPEDRSCVGQIADWLRGQGFLAAVTEEGPVTKLLISWGGV